MADRFAPKITSIFDENRREMHVICATVRNDDDPAHAFYSTSTRTFTEEEVFGGNSLHRVEYKDRYTIRYMLPHDSAWSAALGDKQPTDSDLEMIDLVDKNDSLEISNPQGRTAAADRADVGASRKLIQNVPFTSNEIKARVRKQRGETNKKMSEQETMIEGLAKCRHIMEYLKDDQGDGKRQLRVTHTLFMRRELGFLSARVRIGHGDQFSAIGIVWQTMVRPQRAICITVSRTRSGTSVLCTCDRLLSARKREVTDCEHVDACRGVGNDFGNHVLRILSDESPDGYFGSDAARKDDTLPVVQLERKSPRQVTARTAGALEGWSFWTVFDLEKNVFVPVLKILGKAFQCQLCRSSTSRRGLCSHEASCRDLWSQRTMQEDIPREDDRVILNEGSDSGEVVLSVTPSKGQGDGNLDKYMRNDHERTILMCPGDAHYTIKLAQSLDKLKRGRTLHVLDVGASCPHCSADKSEDDRTHKRSVRLFTVSHGVPLVNVEDWECGSCGKLVFFSGKGLGLFPVRRNAMYTVELLYNWVQMVCYQGESLRTSYFASKLTGSARSTLQRYRGRYERAGNYKGEAKRSRRRANEAFRGFLKYLDVHSEQMTTKLFSCDECEEELTDTDKRELGLGNTETDGLKRFKAVVIDGTAAGILANLPKFRDSRLKIPVSRPLRGEHRMVTTLANKKTIKLLCSLARKRVREVFSHAITGGTSGQSSVDGSAFTFYLSKVIDPRKGKKKKKPHMTGSQIDIARMYLDPQTCLCTPERPVNATVDHDEYCKKRRATFRKWREPVEVASLLQSCFEVMLCTEVEEEEPEMSSEDMADAVDEDFLPDREEHEDQLEEDEEVGHSGRGKPVWMAQLRIPRVTGIGQLIESLLDLVEFLTTDHAAMVYILPLNPPLAEVSVDGDDPCEAKFKDPGILALGSAVLAEPSLRLHDGLVSRLLELADCNQDVTHSTTGSWACSDCKDAVNSCLVHLSEVNPILVRFCDELVQSGARAPDPSRKIAKSVANALREHIEIATNYLETFDCDGSPESWEYWEKYASVMLEEMPGDEGSEMDDAIATGVCFPGRRRFRPGIVFEGKESYQCNKEYPRSTRFSPGLLTVQCVCERPKLIGFIVMERAESTSLALSSVLTHFRIPPRVVYYDNGCNLFVSTLLRTPWVLHLSRVVVDRFHYKGHKCSAFFDPDSYETLDTQRSTSAESFNARIERALYHMRYLRGENLIPFLRIRFALLNLAARYQQKYQVSDMEDVDLTQFLWEELQCNCPACERLQEDGEKEREEGSDEEGDDDDDSEEGDDDDDSVEDDNNEDIGIGNIELEINEAGEYAETDDSQDSHGE